MTKSGKNRHYVPPDTMERNYIPLHLYTNNKDLKIDIKEDYHYDSNKYNTYGDLG